MLGWLSAAAAPLLIHLWSRRRYRQIPWAAMQFLLAAMRSNARRLRLQQWLLIAIRTLIILLVVLAVAEPYSEGLLAGGAGAPTHRVLVVDASFSMSYRDGDDTLFARAQRLAADVVRASGPSDVFTIIQMDASPRVVVDRETIDRDALSRAIESLEPTQAGADLHAACALIDEALTPTQNVNRATERQEIVFFTDLQRASWQNQRAPLASETVTAQSNATPTNPDDPLAALAAKAKVVVVDLSPDRRTNLALTRLSSRQPYATLLGDSLLEATLHEFGDEPRRECVVELLVDAEPVGSQVVDVPPDGEVSVRFTHRFSRPGAHAVAVRAAPDALEIDNTRWLAMKVAEEIRVLCVEGQPGAARFVADALDPDPIDKSPLHPIIVSEGGLAEVEFDDFACLIFCNVARLTANEAMRVARYVEQGGGVIFFLGDQVQADDYNLLAAGERPLLPAELGGIVADPGVPLDPRAYRHPVVAPFRGRERSGLITTPVARYVRLILPDPPGGREVALAFSNGDPLIVTKQLGRGYSVLVATDASLSSVDAKSGEPWTAWPTWPSFLPIVRELVHFAMRGQATGRAQLIGQPLQGALNRASSPLLQIRRPDGRTDTVLATESDLGASWRYDRTDASGIYSIAGADNGAQAATESFAVNVDTNESDLRKVDRSDLPSQVDVRADWQPSPGPIDDRNPSLQRSTWHGALLGTAFGLLLLESLLAWYCGRGAA